MAQQYTLTYTDAEKTVPYSKYHEVVEELLALRDSLCEVREYMLRTKSEKLLTVREAADQYGLTETAIRQAVHENRLNACKIDGKSLGIKVRDIHRYADKVSRYRRKTIPNNLK